MSSFIAYDGDGVEALCQGLDSVGLDADVYEEEVDSCGRVISRRRVPAVRRVEEVTETWTDPSTGIVWRARYEYTCDFRGCRIPSSRRMIGNRWRVSQPSTEIEVESWTDSAENVWKASFEYRLHPNGSRIQSSRREILGTRVFVSAPTVVVRRQAPIVFRPSPPIFFIGDRSRSRSRSSRICGSTNTIDGHTCQQLVSTDNRRGDCGRHKGYSRSKSRSTAVSQCKGINQDGSRCRNRVQGGRCPWH